MSENINYPKRHRNHEIDDVATSAFKECIDNTLFAIQKEDKRDYGVDIHLEVLVDSGSAVTNNRLDVQIKGTEKNQNKDGSVSVSGISVTNLNYLMSNSNAIYICYHLPSKRLLVRTVESVLREYIHKNNGLESQDSITVRFNDEFNETYQSNWHKLAYEYRSRDRNKRVKWSSANPIDNVDALCNVPEISVPSEEREAYKLLVDLYESGHDQVISKNFELFDAVLGLKPTLICNAYMSEVNLGISDFNINGDRVKKAISIFDQVISEGLYEVGSMYYCIGNAYSALREHSQAIDFYRKANELLCDDVISSMCWKNMGGSYDALGEIEDSRVCYEKALSLNPRLPEAHMALGLWFHQNGKNPDKALEHFDKAEMVRGQESIQGWRIEVLFMLGDYRGAFREIQSLLRKANQLKWVWGWCAKQIHQHGRSNLECAEKTLDFWERYLRENGYDKYAMREHFLAQCYLKMSDRSIDVDYALAKEVLDSLEGVDIDSYAYTADRIGHCAQIDGDWVEAEKLYRLAANIDEASYGYCLGVALNNLKRYPEAYEVLLPQAEKFIPDEKSWFQVAIALEGMSRIEDCIDAYKKAIEVEPMYDHAWFNLGGVYWNARCVDDADAIWSEAIQRFPDHDNVRKLRELRPCLFKRKD